MDTDTGTVTEGTDARRRFLAWYGEWSLRVYAALAVAAVVGAGDGSATGALSRWNARGMVATLAALSAFVGWRARVAPAFGDG